MNVLNKMLGTNVNAEPLVKEAEEIEARLQRTCTNRTRRNRISSLHVNKRETESQM